MYHAKVTYAGTTYESGNLSAKSAYDAGARYGLQHVSITGYDMVYQSGTNYGYKVKVKLTGTYEGTTLYDNWYTSGWVLNATNAYNNGWSGSYGEIAISPVSNRTLDPGESVAVSAQGKASSDAGLSTVASITVKARAISLRTVPTAIRPSTSNTPIEIGDGYDGLNRIVVEGSANLLAENIKKGVSIFGVNGTYDNYTGGHDVVPFLGSSSSTTYANRTTTVSSNGTYYVRAIGRSAEGASYDTYVGGSRSITVSVPSSSPTGGAFSRSSSPGGTFLGYASIEDGVETSSKSMSFVIYVGSTKYYYRITWP